MINALIVDDEPYCCELLATLLEKYCPQVHLLSVCSSGEQALKSIKELNPELLFLDVEMPRMNGFEMLERIENINFELIFTTSFNHYAIRAIKFSAIDYLLKPIDRDELQAAIRKINTRLRRIIPQQLELLLQQIKPASVPVSKVAMPTMEGLQMISIDHIISCKSDSNYTIIMMKGNQRLTVSRTLKEIEEVLEEYSFARVHHSYLVNLNEINKYIKGEGGYLQMSDGTAIDVSRSKKETLIKKLLRNKG